MAIVICSRFVSEMTWPSHTTLFKWYLTQVWVSLHDIRPDGRTNLFCMLTSHWKLICLNQFNFGLILWFGLILFIWQTTSKTKVKHIPDPHWSVRTCCDHAFRKALWAKTRRIRWDSKSSRSPQSLKVAGKAQRRSYLQFKRRLQS